MATLSGLSSARLCKHTCRRRDGMLCQCKPEILGSTLGLDFLRTLEALCLRFHRDLVLCQIGGILLPAIINFS